MAFLDALAILASGAARGYRGSQEIQRQLAEAKRRALLEEREQAVRERLADSQIAQGSSEIDYRRLLGEQVGEETIGRREARTEAGRPLMRPGSSFSADILGNRLSILDPTARSLAPFMDYLGTERRERGATARQGMETGFRREELGARLSDPEKFGGTKASKEMTPEERRFRAKVEALNSIRGEFFDNRELPVQLQTRFNFLMDDSTGTDKNRFKDR